MVEALSDSHEIDVNYEGEAPEPIQVELRELSPGEKEALEVGMAALEKARANRGERVKIGQ